MSMFDDLKKAKADLFSDNIEMIDVDELHASEDNIFDIVRIDEFAETILGQGGVKENLIIKPIVDDEDGGYEIISGHRRFEAIKFLLEKGENVSRLLPCLIANYESEDDKKLDLILMNISSRIITDAEMWRAYEILNEILQDKKKHGEKFGKIQKKLAELMGVSVTQMAKIQKIDHSTIQPVKKAVEDGDMSIATAYEVAKLSEDEQEKLLDNNAPKDIKYSEIKKTNDSKKGINVDTFSEIAENDEDVEEEFEDENSEEIAEDTSFSDKKKDDFLTEKSENGSGMSRAAIGGMSEYPLENDGDFVVVDPEKATETDDYIRDGNGRFSSVDETEKSKTDIKDFLIENKNIVKNIFKNYRDLTSDDLEIEVINELEKLLEVLEN